MKHAISSKRIGIALISADNESQLAQVSGGTDFGTAKIAATLLSIAVGYHVAWARPFATSSTANQNAMIKQCVTYARLYTRATLGAIATVYVSAANMPNWIKVYWTEVRNEAQDAANIPQLDVEMGCDMN